MKRYSRHIFLLALLLTFAYNACMCNSSKIGPRILTSAPGNLILGNDSIKGLSTRKPISVDRGAINSSFLITKPLDKPSAGYSNVFKLTPLKLVGLINPALELGYERKTGSSFSTQIVASYLLPISIMDLGYSFKPDIKGFQASIEEKFYFEKSAPAGPYLSFEFKYLKNQYKDIWNFGVKDIYSDSTYNFTNYPDTFGIKKQTYSFNLKVGYQLIYKRLSLDCYGGFGLKYRDVEHFDKIHPEDEMERPRHPNIDYISNRKGKYWTVSIPLNIRIGWTF